MVDPLVLIKDCCLHSLDKEMWLLEKHRFDELDYGALEGMTGPVYYPSQADESVLRERKILRLYDHRNGKAACFMLNKYA